MDDLRVFPARPVVGVGAVILDDDRVLLAKRSHEPLKGEWSLPGGAVEIGETLEAALIREVLEETGLTIEVGPIVEVFERIQTAADQRVQFHYVIIDYLCRPVGVREPAAGSDASAVAWVAEPDLESHRLTDKATAVIKKAFEISASRRSTQEPPAGR